LVDAVVGVQLELLALVVCGLVDEHVDDAFELTACGALLDQLEVVLVLDLQGALGCVVLLNRVIAECYLLYSVGEVDFE